MSRSGHPAASPERRSSGRGGALRGGSRVTEREVRRGSVVDDGVNDHPNPFPSDSWPGDHALGLSFAWTLGLLVVFAPLAVRRYRAIER
jgi:hypothetical protein